MRGRVVGHRAVKRFDCRADPEDSSGVLRSIRRETDGRQSQLTPGPDENRPAETFLAPTECDLEAAKAQLAVIVGPVCRLEWLPRSDCTRSMSHPRDPNAGFLHLLCQSSSKPQAWNFGVVGIGFRTNSSSTGGSTPNQTAPHRRRSQPFSPVPLSRLLG